MHRTIVGVLILVASVQSIDCGLMTKLEEIYKSIRPDYDFEVHLEQVPVERKREIVDTLNHLTGKNKLPDGKQAEDGAKYGAAEMEEALAAMNRDRAFLEKQDKYKSLINPLNPTELSTLANKVWPKSFDKDKYLKGDEAAIKEFQQYYQNGVLDVIRDMKKVRAPARDAAPI